MIEENVPSTSMFSISFDFKEILGSHEQVGEREGEGEGETRQRVATIVEAFREFRQLKSTDDRMAVARGSGALQALRRKRYLRGMFFSAAVSLIEIDYPEPGVPFFREDASLYLYRSLPPPPSLSLSLSLSSFVPRHDLEGVKTPHNYRERSLRRFSDIRISRGKRAYITLKSKSFSLWEHT